MEITETFWGKVEPRGSDDCWVWAGARDLFGYGYIQRHQRGPPRIKNWKAHRVSWELHRGPIPQGLLVLHHCDNPPCVNPAHLYIGTKKDNARDRARRGRGRENRQFGTTNPNARLSDEEVLAIRAAAVAGETQQSIADRLGISQPQVSRIVRRISR